LHKAHPSQQVASAGTIQLTMHAAAAPVSLPVSTVASKQLPDVTMVRMHNVPGGINVHGLMACLLKHFQFGPEYTVVLEFFFFFFFFFWEGEIFITRSNDTNLKET